MNPVGLALVCLLLVPAALAWVPRLRPAASVVATAGLALAVVAVLALPPGPDALRPWGSLLAGLLAAVGGGPVTAQLLAWADRLTADRTATTARPSVPAATAATADAADASVRPAPRLQGGAWIGVLERIGVAAGLLAGWPEAIAIVLAVKGLGRYPDLKEGAAAERFIIGTFTSVLWAVGACGLVLLR